MGLFIKKALFKRKEGKNIKLNGNKESEITLSDFLNANNKFNRIEISGMNFLKYYFEKLDNNISNKIGDFGERVEIEIIKYDNNTVKNNFKYMGDIVYEFKIVSSKTKEILVDNINVNVDNYCSEINITEKFIKTLMQNCFSGIYRSIFDFEELYKAMNDIGFKINETYLPFYCDVCKKNLNNAQSFLNHIKNTKHKTDIEKDFPYCEETIKTINNK